MSEFYLPYHFIAPVPREHSGSLPVAEFRKGKEGKLEGVRHDRYEPGTHSGTIECTVEAISPVFIGDEKAGAECAGFKLNGSPAFPATSLRGMVGAVAEGASNSALRVLSSRVLGQPCYSYRKRMQDPLSAIGMLWKEGEEWKLEPVCLPLLQFDQGGRLRPEMQKWKSVFPAGPVFRVFVGDKDGIRRDRDDALDVEKKKFNFRTTVAGATKRPSYPIAALKWEHLAVMDPAKLPLNVKVGKFQQTVVAQRPGKAPMRSGLLRVLGCYEKGADGKALRQMPDGKTHELFLPYEPGQFAKLAVAAAVMEKFQQLADQMTEQSEYEATPRPFEPKDTRLGRLPGERLVPKEGDLVFFEVDAAGKQVTEFSYSSIWRGRVEHLGTAANAWTFFDRMDLELTPFHGQRKQITLAERVFGLVEEKDGEELKNGLRLKGRVRFSPGIAHGAITELPPVPLKELSSPKTPSPAIYFRKPQDQNEYIAKRDLKPGAHWPQGRKVYLHHPKAIHTDASPWDNSKGGFAAERHVRVRPWAKGSKWKFAIQFDNLSDLELGMVLYALSPTKEFRHKIGMGKPLGLGSVHVKVETVRLVNRQTRYSAAGWAAERFAPDLAWQALRDSFRQTMNAKLRGALETLGDPQKLGNFEITYPRVDNQHGDDKLYEWYVSNEQQPETERESLQPVAFTTQGRVEARVPTLNRLPVPRKR